MGEDLMIFNNSEFITENIYNDCLVKMFYEAGAHVKYKGDIVTHSQFVTDDYRDYIKCLSAYVEEHAQKDAALNSNNTHHLFDSLENSIINNDSKGQTNYLLYNFELKLDSLFDSFQGIKTNAYKELLDENNKLNLSFQNSKNYLSLIYEYLREIFKPQWMNNGLDLSLRNSHFVYNLFKMGIYSETDSVIEYSSVFAPFSYASLTQSIESYYYFLANTERDVIFKLRQQLFFRKIRRNLIRHYKKSFNSEIRRLQYDKTTSSLQSLPYSKITSIEDIKPIRILEKILYHLQKKITTKNEQCNKSDLIEIKIGIIGNYPFDGSEVSPKIQDLLNSIYVWIKDNYSSIRLELTLEFVKQSDDDKTSIFKFPPEADINNSMDIQFIVCLKKCELFELENNAFILNNLINQNEIVFIWDCPWLSEEKFDIENHESLESFSRSVSNTSYVDDFESNELFKHMEKRGIFNRIDNQLNRITSSNTDKAGTVTRVPRDYILDYIRRHIVYFKEQHTNKTVYLYYSTKNGFNYSKYKNYIFSRDELYGGKKISILKFTSDATESLIVDNRIHFEFDLWSIIKYTEISYAFNDMKQLIDECVADIHDFSVYLRVLKNTYIIIEPFMKAEIYNINVMFNIEISDCIKKVVNDSWLESVHSFISCLFLNAVFSDNDTFGNTCIKKAFEIILYSHAKNLDNLYFYEKYCYYNQKNRLNDIFRVNYNSSLQLSTQHLFYDTFSDRKLYSKIIRRTLWSDSFDFDIISLLKFANIDAEGDYSYHNILNNLLNLIKQYGSITDSQELNTEMTFGEE